MGECILHGSGGVDLLNFHVVGGTTQPSNPKENTVWVNTSLAVNGWHVAKEQPAGMATGDVWIPSGRENSAAINALKKNAITVSISPAQQKTSSGLVKVPTKLYRSGAWETIESIVFLYNNGDECTHLTGGWTGKNGYGITKNADYFRVEKDALVHSTNKINVTAYSKITVRGKSTKAGMSFGLGNTTSGFTAGSAYVSTSGGTSSIDISDVQGEYNVMFATDTSSTIDVYEIYLTE